MSIKAETVWEHGPLNLMKVIGLIGGMSWESTAEYYSLINESVKAKLGGLHSAKCVLYSVDFAEIEEMQRVGQWSRAANLLTAAAQNVERAGADLLLLCTNTMHKVADAIQSGIGIPLLHIADAAGERIAQAGIRRVGLLGTRMTMEEDFYRQRLADGFGLQVVVPDSSERETVHRIIYDELCLGTIRSQSKEQVSRIAGRLCEGGAEAVLLACTELGLLVGSEDCAKPLFDTTRLHALAAVELALKS
jgi:aspartate racemase